VGRQQNGHDRYSQDSEEEKRAGSSAVSSGIGLEETCSKGIMGSGGGVVGSCSLEPGHGGSR
jgi:hypothetical protein